MATRPHPQARGLAAADANGLSDPLVVLSLLDKAGRRVPNSGKRTATIHSTLDPEWREDFVIGSTADVSAATHLHVEVRDADFLSYDCLGHVTIELAGLCCGGACPSDADQQFEWYALEQGRITQREVTGQIELAVSVDLVGERDRGADAAIDRHRRIHVHAAGGLASRDGYALLDTYAVVHWNGRRVGATEPEAELANPRWDFSCTAKVDTREQKCTGAGAKALPSRNVLRVSVCNHATRHRHHLIPCRATSPLSFTPCHAR